MGLNGKATILIDRTYAKVSGDFPGIKLDEKYSYVNPGLAKVVNKQHAEVEGEFEIGRSRSGRLGTSTNLKQFARGARIVEAAKNHRKNTVHLFDMYTGEFPSGLAYEIADFLREEDIDVSINDISNPPVGMYAYKLRSTYKGEPLVLRKYQKEALEAADKYRTGIFSMATNAGKSLIASALIERKRVKTLVLVQGQEMLDQWVDFIQDYLGLQVGIVRGGIYKPAPITVAIINSAARRVDELVKEDFEMCVVDEAHHAAAATHFKVVKSIDPYYVYGLTGTAFRTRKVEESALMASFGRKIYEIDNNSMQSMGYSLPVEVDVRFLEQENISDLTDWTEIYQHYVCYSVPRNKLLVDIIKEYYDKGHSILIPLNQVSHCNSLAHALTQHTDIPYALGHGRLTNSYRRKILEDFKSKKLRVLIGTLYSEAIDISSISVVINAGGLKSPIQIFQRIGRGLRLGGMEKLHYVDLYDLGNYYLEQHSSKRMDSIKLAGCALPKNIVDFFTEKERELKAKLELSKEDLEAIKQERELIAKASFYKEEKDL